MSDNKRSRKYHNLKESKRTILLAKKDESTVDERPTASHTDAPKILLKPKEKPIASTTVQPPPPISIATRENTAVDPSRVSSPTPNRTSQLQHPVITAVTAASTLSAVKELQAPVIVEQPAAQIPRMQKSIVLVNDHFQLSTAPFDFLVDSNANFFVVGIVGAQGVGKSTLLNLLCPTDSTTTTFSRSRDSVFATKRTQEQQYSSEPTTYGIRMYITKDRTILLDCAPVLCNPYKKDYVLNEIDDLKMVIFMMSVCHLLIVVQDDVMHGGLLRLLHCAEMMKPNLDKDGSAAAASALTGKLGEEYLPNVLFVKNMANARDFQSANVERINRMYKFFFHQSKLRMYAGNHRPADDNMDEVAEIVSGSRRPAIQRSINFFVFPMIQTKSEIPPPSYTGHPEIHLLIAQYRQRVFGTPRNSFQTLPPLTPFLEKNWSHLVVNAWESHKNNYFLRKYENFKEWTNRSSIQ